jgi:hypothetical protein
MAFERRSPIRRALLVSEQVVLSPSGSTDVLIEGSFISAIIVLELEHVGV